MQQLCLEKGKCALNLNCTENVINKWEGEPYHTKSTTIEDQDTRYRHPKSGIISRGKLTEKGLY